MRGSTVVRFLCSIARISLMSVASRDDFIMRFMIFSNACANSLYQALFFVSPCLPACQKRGTGDEATLMIEVNLKECTISL